MIISEYKRIKCPECGNENPRMLHDEPDKKTVLYYSMQGTPVYSRKMKCGSCSHEWKKQ